MLRLHFRPPEKSDIKYAIIAFAALILIMFAMLVSGCVSLRQKSGPAREWNAPPFKYAPDLGTGVWVEPISDRKFNCTDPEAHDYVCLPADSIDDLYTNVIGKCKAWE